MLVSNATLQWVPDHLELLPRLVEQVAPGGWFAFQVPGNFGEPSHTIRTEIADRAPYAEHVRGVAVPASHEPDDYFEVLARRSGARSTSWETTYLHVLTGDDPVFDLGVRHRRPADAAGAARRTCGRTSRRSSRHCCARPTRPTRPAAC